MFCGIYPIMQLEWRAKSQWWIFCHALRARFWRHFGNFFLQSILLDKFASNLRHRLEFWDLFFFFGNCLWYRKFFIFDALQRYNILNLFPNRPWFLRVCTTSLLKTLWVKGEIARNEQFLLFPECLLPIWRAFCHFHHIWNCRLQTLWVWKRIKFVVWERVKAATYL